MRISSSVLTGLSLLLICGLAKAAVPQSLNYQGYLTNTDGTPVDGNVVIMFSIYNAEFGGSALWFDTQLVVPDQGLFSIELGNPVNPFPPALFNGPLFLGINIDGDGEMLPRRRLTSVGFAFEADNAGTLQGAGPAAYDQSGHVIDTANPHGVTATQVGAATAADIASLQSQLDAAVASIAALQSDLATTQADLASANSAIASLQGDLAAETSARIADVAALNTAVADIQANTVLALDGMLTLDQTDPVLPAALFTGLNVQVVNGTGTTEGDPNGVGNVIVGYNLEDNGGSICSLGAYDNETDCESNSGIWAQSHKTGSHSVIIGDRHNYSRYSGFVAGANNNITGIAASVSGGIFNIARGDFSSVTSGFRNSANDAYSSVSGGEQNVANGASSSVSGGFAGIAGGFASSVSGGANNVASGFEASVSGGSGNEASGSTSNVSGGSQNSASDTHTSVTGGVANVASGIGASVTGGFANSASGARTSISGGRNNNASGSYASVSGGGGALAADGNDALADYSSISGGTANVTTAGADQASITGGQDNNATGVLSHISGGRANLAWGNWSVIAGGNSNTTGNTALATDDAVNRYSVVTGGQFNITRGQYSVVSGGNARSVDGIHDWRGGGSFQEN